MAFTYKRGSKKAWEIDTKQLRHPYYAQLTPDGERLVLGRLHQGRPPAIGNWLQVGTITQPFEERYFVQQTNFNTLVPGSLIQSPAQPDSSWKDVRKPSTSFHYFWFDSTYLAIEPSTEHFIADSDELFQNFITPALNTIYPGRDTSIHFVLQFFYFLNDIENMNNDPANLVKFSGTTPLRLVDINTSTYVDNMLGAYGVDHELYIEPDAPDAYYSVILGVEDPTTHIITDYIVLVDLVQKRLAA